MELRRQMIPCMSREAVVTVLSYEGGILDGYLQHPRLKEKKRIRSLSQTVLLLDDLLNLEDCPGSPVPLVSGGCGREEKKEVFRIQVLFREHHSWQGRLIWQNESQEAVFRSTLEFIQLFDTILGE